MRCYTGVFINNTGYPMRILGGLRLNTIILKGRGKISRLKNAAAVNILQTEVLNIQLRRATGRISTTLSNIN